MVSGNFFPVLGVRPFAGRLVGPEDDREGAPAVAVISYAIWQSKFHGDPRLVGETVLLTGHPVTIVGIGAEGFFAAITTKGIPQACGSRWSRSRSFSRSASSTTFRSHTGWIQWSASAIRRPFPWWRVQSRWSCCDGFARTGVRPHDTEEEIARQTTELAPAKDGINDLRDDYQKSLTILQMITGFVLLIVCANLANLMLVRGVARRQELSIRTALELPARAWCARCWLRQSCLRFWEVCLRWAWCMEA